MQKIVLNRMLALLVVCIFVSPVLSQPIAGLALQDFDLVVPTANIKSQATLSATQLQIRGSDGSVTSYARSQQHDSADGKWLGYYSAAARQIIRWPSSNSGGLEIGSEVAGRVAYRPSKMTIRTSHTRSMNKPVLPPVNPAVSNPNLQPGGAPGQVGGVVANLAASKLFDLVSQRKKLPSAQMLRIATTDVRGAPWLLSRSSGSSLRAISSGSSGADWFATPVGQGYIRLQTYRQGKVYSLSASNRSNLGLAPAAQDPQQLWMVSAGMGQNQFWLQNAAFPGTCLAHSGAGALALQPLAFNQAQMWSPYVAPQVTGFQPFYRSVTSQFVANPPLPPAKLTLDNRHRYALVIALGDSRKGADFEQLRIEPGQSLTLELERDSGARIVETVEYRTLLGGWRREEYVTAVPPSVQYDLSVYEEHLQSIAIDRTGTSPNPIEDVNYVPKSVGWLPLPVGEGLPEVSRMDLYAKAKQARNPGGVRRLDAKQFNAKTPERPLEQILKQHQSVRRRKF